MIIDMPFTVLEDRGSVYFDYFRDSDIMVNISYHDLTQTLDYNKLYEVRGSLGAWQFRFGSCVFLNNTNTYIYNVRWNNGVRPQTAGLYNFRVLQSEKKEVFGRAFCMIGDSITWWERGGDFRNLLRTKGLKYDFAGNNVDPWGFRHCGNGGYNTEQTLNIVNQIPVADTYFILLGTNDRIAPEQTVNNLKELILALKGKDCCCRIYISTLLPRNDEFNARNTIVNTLLKAENFGNRITLIDSAAAFTSNLLNDGLHPTAQGYEVLCNNIVPYLK